MSVPKSVIKFKKNGIEYTSSVDRTKYLLSELTRAALRDVGKFLRREVKKRVPFNKGILKKNIGTWVRSRDEKLQIGVYNRARAKKKGYPYAYHAHLVEFGTSKTKAQPFLRPSVMENIDTIRRIEGQYLKAIEDENKALGLINEKEEISDD